MPSKMNTLSQAIVGSLLLAAQGMANPSAPATGNPSSPTLPAALPFERYAAMIERSPFAVASQAAPPPPVVEVPGFAKDLVVTGAVRLPNGEYITLASRDQKQRFGLRTGETSASGISIVSVAWSEAVGKTKVTLKCGSEFGVVGFDEALMSLSTPQEIGLASANGQSILPPGVTLPNPNASLPPGMSTNPANPSNPPGVPVLRRRVIRNVPAAP